MTDQKNPVGRPKTRGKKKDFTLSFRVDESTLIKLEYVAGQQQGTVNAVARSMLLDYLDKNTNNVGAATYPPKGYQNG